jgi:hypothetical protein
MQFKPVTVFFVLSLVFSAISPFGIAPLYADDGAQQPSAEQKVIEPWVEGYLSSLKPTDNITFSLKLKTDPEVEEQINDIRKKYSEIMSIELRRAWRTVPSMSPNESINIVSKRLRLAEREEISALEEQAYLARQQQVIEQISKMLPGAEMRWYSDSCLLNYIDVKTEVGNIEALSTIPNVLEISPGIFGGGYPWLRSPAQDSVGLPVDILPFTWSFSWNYIDWAIMFRFVLSTDPSFVNIVREAEVPTNYYDYYGNLEYGTKYYWKIIAFEPNRAIWTSWSDTFSFQTEAAPLSPQPITSAPPSAYYWPASMTVAILITLVVTGSLIMWLVVARRRKTK